MRTHNRGSLRSRVLGLAVAGLALVCVRLDGAAWWRLPLWGAEVRAFAVDPFEPGVVYCGTLRGNFYGSRDAGATWIERVTRTYPACVWLNPVPESQWGHTHSIKMMRQLMGGRMYPLTLEGLDRAMRELVR